MTQSFHANGKLLLTAEYFVLDGAIALALPVNRGQQLLITTSPVAAKQFHWQSYTMDGQVWFEGFFENQKGLYLHGSDEAIGKKLSEIFGYILNKRPDFLQASKIEKASTQLAFPRAWGLGTSSTLIASLAAWANIDAYELQFAAFGGSGYDIACAMTQHPILYQKVPAIKIEKVDFAPSFSKHLYFVYLGKKQNSRSGIAHYRASIKAAPQLIDEVTQLTKACVSVSSLKDFEHVLGLHEDLIAKNLHLQTAKSLYFSDFWGTIKSLGAWGGDFVLATSDRTVSETRTYFQERGFDTLYQYDNFTDFNAKQ